MVQAGARSDPSNVQAAQHCAGDVQAEPDVWESVLQVEFPERSGALVKFLRVLNPVWNISLFHYRQSGNRASTILLGLQVALHPACCRLADAAWCNRIC